MIFRQLSTASSDSSASTTSSGVFGILQLVAADSQRTVRPEGITELRPYRIVDRDVAAFGRGS